jgi:hypothetical protein
MDSRHSPNRSLLHEKSRGRTLTGGEELQFLGGFKTVKVHGSDPQPREPSSANSLGTKKCLDIPMPENNGSYLTQNHKKIVTKKIVAFRFLASS